MKNKCTHSCTPTHSHPCIKKSLCCFAMPHTANPLNRQNIMQTRQEKNTPWEKPLYFTHCDCMCDCKNMQVSVPQVTQISAKCEPNLTLDVESTLCTAHKTKFVSCYSSHPRHCYHPLLGNCGGDGRCHQQGFTSSIAEWQEAGERNWTHWRGKKYIY